ncbi:MAG: NAD(P)H-binding protein [Deltaproteobacteria bacterium]|jgi:uncharacterized protein YbjT (DUF2867 family)
MTRRIFVAGSTGATGRTLFARHTGPHLIPHVRPATAAKNGTSERALVADLTDHDALHAALATCTTIVQLIGTMRKRFASGDTYATSDIGTTQQLVDAARGTAVDHVVLLSSVGAGRPMGAYLEAKAEAERIVRDSGIEHTIFRPSAFRGEGHRPPPGMGTLTRALGLAKYQPIPIEELADAIHHVAVARGPMGVLEGDALWRVVRSATA